MEDGRPLIVVVPRHELPDDEPIQLILDDHDQPCTWRIREDTPIASVADAINDVALRRLRRSKYRDLDVRVQEP